MFALVHFIESNTVAVVPVHWLSGKYCFWPNSKDVGKLAKAFHSPKSDWKKYEVVVKSIYGSYDEAKHFETRYEETSNLDTEEEDLGKGKRGIKRKRLFLNNNNSSASSDEESQSLLELPPCPVSAYQAPRTSLPISVPVLSETAETPNNYIVLAENKTPLSQPRCSVDSDSHSTIMREILHLKLQMKQQNEMLSSVLTSLNILIERTNQPETVTRMNNTLPVKLPIENMEDLSFLESELHNSEVKELLYDLLRQTGGINLGNMVRRMLAKLMSNELAVKFSWLGAKEKEAFSSLKISQLIFSAVRENAIFQRATDQEIETVIKDWLRHAKARKSKLKE